MKKEINLTILKEKLQKYIDNQITKSLRNRFSISVKDLGEAGKRLILLCDGEKNSMSSFEWGNFCEQIKYSYRIHPDNISE